MRISSHEIAGGADASSRTLVSGQVRPRSRTHFGGGPDLSTSISNAHNQRSAAASTGVNPPSVLASVTMLGTLYHWWAGLMIRRMTGRDGEPPGWAGGVDARDLSRKAAKEAIMSTKKHLSRVYLFGAVVLSALVLLTACGSDNKSSASNTRTPAASALRSAGASSSPRTSSSPAASGTRSPSASSSAGAALEIKMVPSIKFDKTELTADAGKDVKLTVNNTDDGVRHNFVLYKTKADADADKNEIASSKVCNGPCKETLDLNLTPGEYYFHCSVHPQQMTGTLNAK